MKELWRFTSFIWTGVFLAGVLGCGGNPDQYGVVPVRGVITCKGVPMAKAFVNFTPLDQEDRKEGRPGRPALGVTDEEGKFELTTYENGDGAIVGKHRVSVGPYSATEVDNPDAVKKFPCINSTMEIEVKPGMGEVKIEF